jgi:hypothetical protein
MSFGDWIYLFLLAYVDKYVFRRIFFVDCDVVERLWSKNISLKINHQKTLIYIKKTGWMSENEDEGESEGEVERGWAASVSYSYPPTFTYLRIRPQ